MHWWLRTSRHVEWIVASLGNKWGDFWGKIPFEGIDNDQDVNYYRRGTTRTSLCLHASATGNLQAYTDFNTRGNSPKPRG